MNPAFEKITGYSEEEACGQRPSMLKSGLHDQTFYADMYHALERVGIWRGEVWNKRKNGKLYPQQLMISAVREGGASASTSPSSAISPRPSWRSEDRCPGELRQPHRAAEPLAVRPLPSPASASGASASPLMVLDLNNFKAVNNSMDHHVGDALLEVSDRLVSRAHRGSGGPYRR